MNTGGRWGGAITAAMFLKEFAEDTPWIHLDIAGVAWMEENKPWIAKGPTGIAVRRLVEFVQTLLKVTFYITEGAVAPITASARMSPRRATAAVASSELFSFCLRLRSGYGAGDRSC